MKPMFSIISGLFMIFSQLFSLHLGNTNFPKQTLSTPNGSMPDLSDRKNIKLVGQIGGALSSVKVQNKMAFIGEGYYLTVLDLADPIQPQVIGKSAALPGQVTSLTVVDPYVYITTWGDQGGLTVVDVSDPHLPKTISTLPLNAAAEAVDVVNDRAYVANDRDGLVVVDVSNKQAPAFLAHKQVKSGNLTDVVVQGPYAYATSKGSGLYIYDISDLAKISQVGMYPSLGANRLEVINSTVYLTDEADGLLILDVDLNNKKSPALIASYGLLAGMVDLELNNGIVYASTSAGQVCALNVSDPQAILKLGCTSVNLSFGDLSLSENALYATTGEDGCLSEINVSDLVALKSACLYQVPGYGQSSSMLDGFLYETQAYQNIAVMDLTHPNQPTTASIYRAQPGTMIEQMAISNTSAFLATSGSGLQILSLKDPGKPDYSSSFFPEQGDLVYANDVVVAGPVAYVAADYGNIAGVLAFDISDLASPRLIGSYNTPGSHTDLFLAGSHLFVADGDGGLLVLDVSNPMRMAFAGHYQDMNSVQSVQVVGSRAYVTDFANGLVVLDVTNPKSMALLSLFATRGMPNQVTLNGTRAFLAEGAAGIEVVDISNPALPTQVGYYNTPGYANQVTYQNGYLYVSDAEGGIVILQVAYDIFLPQIRH